MLVFAIKVNAGVLPNGGGEEGELTQNGPFLLLLARLYREDFAGGHLYISK